MLLVRFRTSLIGASLCCMSLAGMSSLCFAEAPQDGTLAPDEAQVLWENATSDFQKENYESAAHALRRLTARIPTHPHGLEAQKLLGEAELRLRNYKAAKTAFQTYLANTQGRGEVSDSVRTLLAETHLQASEPTEALLISERLLSQSLKGRWKRPLDSQIHKTRALIGLGQDKRARAALEIAKKRPFTQSADPAWANDWLSSLEIQLKARQCNQFAFSRSKSTLDEGQVFDRVQRHGLCLEELAVAQSKKPSSASLASVQAIAALEKAKQTFSESCQGPKDVSQAGGVKRTREEQEFYKRELRRKLSEICDPILGTNQGSP